MTNALDNEDTAVADILAKQQADLRVSLSRKECMTAGGWAQSTQIAKEASGVLRRYLDGANVRITAASFYAHLIALASAAPRKARQPKTRFARRRDPTPQEVAGLQRANAHRAKKRASVGRLKRPLPPNSSQKQV
jgi:hypothetical protein